MSSYTISLTEKKNIIFIGESATVSSNNFEPLFVSRNETTELRSGLYTIISDDPDFSLYIYNLTDEQAVEYYKNVALATVNASREGESYHMRIFLSLSAMLIFLMVVSNGVSMAGVLPGDIYLLVDLLEVIVSCAACAFVLKQTNALSPFDGIFKSDSWKMDQLLKSIGKGILISLPLLAIGATMKMVFDPGSLFLLPTPIAPTLIYLIVSVPLQEIVARGVVQANLSKLFQKSHFFKKTQNKKTFFLDPNVFSLIFANLLFTVAHLHLGYGFSLGSMLCGFAWGYIFYKDDRKLTAPIVSHLLVGLALCMWDMPHVLQKIYLTQKLDMIFHVALTNPWIIAGSVLLLIALVYVPSRIASVLRSQKEIEPKAIDLLNFTDSKDFEKMMSYSNEKLSSDLSKVSESSKLKV